MSLFERCRENIIDGRRVYVCSKESEYLDKYTPWILQICSSRKVAKFFPTLWFSLERSTDEAAYIFVDEAAKGIAKVYLVPSEIPDFKTFDAYAIHELIHLWHNYLSGWARKQENSSELLSQVIKKLLLNELQKPNLPNLRQLLHYFVWELQAEGIAQYAQFYAEGKIVFTENYFLKHYRDCRIYAQNLNEALLELPTRFNKLQVKLKIEAGVSGLRYSIGTHMVYSLLFLDQELTLTRIAKMNHFTFIKKYEACMEKRGLRPVVSLTSGAGDFDYKRSLGQWWKAVQQVKS